MVRKIIAGFHQINGRLNFKSRRRRFSPVQKSLTRR
jgi:hypothetical protein